jgi:hypothetical protein
VATLGSMEVTQAGQHDCHLRLNLKKQTCKSCNEYGRMIYIM